MYQPPDNKTQKIAEIMQKNFVDSLFNYPEAIKYIEERGVSFDNIIKSEIGFCPPYAYPRWPLLRGRITVPIRDSYGVIVAFAGRIFAPMQAQAEQSLRTIYARNPEIAQDKIETWRRAKWINEPFSKQRHLFNLNNAKNYIREYGYVIVVEGYMDAIVLALQGVKNVVALCGTALTDLHIAKLSRYCNRIVLLLDGDKVGKIVSDKIILRLEEFKFKTHIIYLPNEYDPDEYILSVTGLKFKKTVDKIVAQNIPKVLASIPKERINYVRSC